MYRRLGILTDIWWMSKVWWRQQRLAMSPGNGCGTRPSNKLCIYNTTTAQMTTKFISALGSIPACFRRTSLCVVPLCVVILATAAGLHDKFLRSSSQHQLLGTVSLTTFGARQHKTSLNSVWKLICLYSRISYRLVSVELSWTTLPFLSVRRPCNVYRHVMAPYKSSFYYYYYYYYE